MRTQDRALERAEQLFDGVQLNPPPPQAIRRRIALGDPQCAPEKLFAILEHHGLLGHDGWLAADVHLLSVGDHFDFRIDDPQTAQAMGDAGEKILRWLAVHAPEQVTLLAGNHDLCRVMELHAFDDEQFAAARAEALARPDPWSEDQLEAYYLKYPSLPSPGMARRDFSGFRARQRDLVQQLLLAGRWRLAAVESIFGRPLLITHAGVTMRELDLLELAEPHSPATIAAALNARLDAGVEGVVKAWQRGQPAPLDLEPLHLAGRSGQEGGGLLYARPWNPDHVGDEGRNGDWAQQRARRYSPLQLPTSLLQACGHVNHRKSLQEMSEWMTEAARGLSLGASRCVHVESGKVVYDQLEAAATAETALIMFDNSLLAADVADIEVLELDVA